MFWIIWPKQSDIWIIYKLAGPNFRVQNANSNISIWTNNITKAHLPRMHLQMKGNNRGGWNKWEMRESRSLEWARTTNQAQCPSSLKLWLLFFVMFWRSHSDGMWTWNKYFCFPHKYFLCLSLLTDISSVCLLSSPRTSWGAPPTLRTRGRSRKPLYSPCHESGPASFGRLRNQSSRQCD